MKLCVMLFFATILQAKATVFAQNASIKVKNASIKTVIKTLREQTGYDFLYATEDLERSKPVSLDFYDVSLREILDACFKEQPLTYRIDHTTVLIKPTVPLSIASARQVTVTGKVVDVDGEPLPSVSISVKENPNIGTGTDENGVFALDVPSNSVLVVSYVGFRTQEVPLNNQTDVLIVLEADATELEEVAVVGFGTQRKVSLIGAQSTVSPNELKLPVASLTQSLAGRLAGVVGVQRSGEPGRSTADIWIRGIATFGGNSSAPLVLVDGVERSINNLDPEDIESFTVLKDASGTAVYGVRGANGVILVKTKSGKIGKPQIFFDYNEGISTFTRRPKLADGITYMNMANEASVGRGLSERYSQEYINNTASGIDPLLYPNVNWMDEIFNETSRNRRANLNAGGGVENAQYYVSLAYFNETGFLRTDDLEQYNSALDFKRYNFTSNLNLKLTATTRLDLGLQGFVSNGNYPGENTEDIFGSAFDVSPVEYPVMYPGGFIPGRAAQGGFRNPYADLTRRGYRTEFRNQLYSNIRLTQDLAMLTEGLNVSAMFSFDAYNENFIKRSKRESTYFPDMNRPYNEDGSLNLVETFNSGGNYLGYDPHRAGNRRFYTEASANYDRGFGKHRVGGLALFYTQDYNNPFAGSFTSSIPERQVGLAMRGTYSYDDRYFVELNAGYNGSELFAPGNRYGFFPAFGLGWVPSNEKFFEPLKGAVSFLKFRYSDGVTGIGRIGDGNGRRFAYLTLVADNALGYALGRGFQNTGGINVTDYGVDIRWAESRKQNLGVEIRTLKDNLYLIFDIFRENRTGIFLQRQSVPSFIGLENAPFGNLGVVDNRGFDATLEYNFQLGQVNLGLRGNITYNMDKLVNDDRPEQPYPWMSYLGNNVLSRYGYIAEKLFDTQEEIDNSAVPGDRSKIRPGDIKFADLNGDGLINDYDRTRIGRGDVPTTVYGFGFDFSYKGFALSTLFQGVHDADVMLGGSAIIPFNGGGGLSNSYSNITDRWTPENPRQDAFYPRLAYGEDQNFNNIQSNSWWVKDISFLRLKSAQISYNLPRHFTNKFGIQNAAVYLIGMNLLTFSKFNLWDPELNTSNGSKYPLAATLSLGLNLKF
ncbi:TonB-dependent receptor [Olivibacter sp. SDN3]|uniref:TonB-dependent receptor n=1 Tax=Olivibacter sp. SDN3 TaxID=2764720 RepID=UPI001651A783|nr:TonB-dependent receptor [Olivibacter sp. SDN3]QNL51752.1 TonB-dependent receptor [Olivibacter sp. SDN3]